MNQKFTFEICTVVEAKTLEEALEALKKINMEEVVRNLKEKNGDIANNIANKNNIKTIIN